MSRMRLALSLLVLSVLLCMPALAATEPGTLQSYSDMANFGVSLSPQFNVDKLGSTGEPAAAFAPVFPADARGLSIVGFRSKDGFYLRLAAASSQGKDVQRPYVAVQVGTAQPTLLALGATATGPLAAASIWSPGQPAQAGAVVVLSFATGQIDTPLLAYAVGADGSVRSIDTGGALTLGGGYELRDLDSDGNYELLTERSLDGWAGGITYIAVRTFDPQTLAYHPDPDKFKDFFRGELAFYDWVLDTRTKMVDDPDSYMSREQRGWYFAADYQGRTVGFDSLVPLPDAPEAGGDIGQWNQRVDSAVRRVTEYHDQLKAWLDGGPYPSAWRITR